MNFLTPAALAAMTLALCAERVLPTDVQHGRRFGCLGVAALVAQSTLLGQDVDIYSGD